MLEGLNSEIGYSFPSSMIIDGISHIDLLVALCKTKNTKIIIIHGDDDKIIPIDNTIKIIESVRSRLDNDDDKKNIEILIVSKMGHNLHEEEPQILVDAIANSIKQ